MVVILGISAYYHDSAAALIINGKIIAAAQEERFSRRKHDSSFPVQAIRYVMQEAGIEGADISYVAFYEKPFIKFERLLETYHAFAPKGIQSFLKAIPVWLKEKLYLKKTLKKELLNLNIKCGILFPEHHLSHAASAFYPSPFEKAAILTIDGVGEWTTTTICAGNGEKLTILSELNFPHSLGLLYSAFTYYCGFRVNSGEYKLMGLAPYGNDSEQSKRYVTLIKEYLIDIRPDGSFLLNMSFFEFATGLKMTNNKKWEKLFGVPPRRQDDELSREYIDLAYAVQKVAEEVILKLVLKAKELTKCSNLVMAGGVALNCVANGKIEQCGLFENCWFQPAAGDAGGSLGAALAVWHIFLGNKRTQRERDSMHYALLGPSFHNKDVQNLIRNKNAEALFMNEAECNHTVASLLNQGKIVGWFHGRMEFGPRALGNRSILADARNMDMQKRLNLEIKFRESFRPFAPSVMEEDAAQYFNLKSSSPYMMKVVEINPKFRIEPTSDNNSMSYLNKLYQHRSFFQAITHVDYTARVQTVSATSNPRFYSLLKTFKELTGYGVLVNTSFNVRGEPVVCTPAHAYDCFMSTGMDYLVIENWLFEKDKQPPDNIKKLNSDRMD